MQTDPYKINRIITLLFILGYIIVNVMMQFNFFSGHNIFDKYQVAASAGDAIQIAQRGYYAKTNFLLLLLIFLVVSRNIYRSIAWSLAVYCVMMLIFFGLNFTTGLYAFGGAICLISYYYGSYLKTKTA